MTDKSLNEKTLGTVAEFDELILSIPRDDSDAEQRWQAHPVEEREYETFAEVLLAGLSQGRDVTLRNAVIDFTSDTEGAAIHLPAGDDGGWSDTDSRCIGSVSRVRGSEVLQEEPCGVVRFRRELSFLSLDVPTTTPDDRVSFHRRVICPLLALGSDTTATDDLYGWLDVFFHLCRGESAAYLSRYAPSRRIAGIAACHDVRIVHEPLSILREEALRAGETFRLLSVTREQWEAVLARLDGSNEGWCR